VFLVETGQTALNGADIYYWFVTGYGDVERLLDSHFGPVDIPIVYTIVSSIVQGYFCYRIWVLNNRSSWLCGIIIVVCIPDCPRILQVSDDSWTQATVAQSVGAIWASVDVSAMHPFIGSSFHAVFSLSKPGRIRLQSLGHQYTYAHSFLFTVIGLSTSCF